MTPATEAPLTVRPATDADLPAVQALVNESWRSAYAETMPAEVVETQIELRHALDVLATQLRAEGTLFLVAERDGAIIGHAYAKPGADGSLFVDRLHVKPKLKGGGIGRRMMKVVFAFAGGERPVTLEVLAANHAARGFYETIGFTNLRQTGAFGGASELPALVMQRPAR